MTSVGRGRFGSNPVISFSFPAPEKEVDPPRQERGPDNDADVRAEGRFIIVGNSPAVHEIPFDTIE